MIEIVAGLFRDAIEMAMPVGFGITQRAAEPRRQHKI
jgi:hypothetical protein